MLPALTVGQFGIERGPQVYGYMFSVFGVSAFSSTIIFSYSIKAFGYGGMFIISSIFTATAATLAFFLDEKKKFNYQAAWEKYRLKQKKQNQALLEW